MKLSAPWFLVNRVQVWDNVLPTPVVLETEQKQGARSELTEALRRCRVALVAVGLLSGLINLLMLTAPLFMLCDNGR